MGVNFNPVSAHITSDIQLTNQFMQDHLLMKFIRVETIFSFVIRRLKDVICL